MDQISEESEEKVNWDKEMRQPRFKPVTAPDEPSDYFDFSTSYLPNGLQVKKLSFND